MGKFFIHKDTCVAGKKNIIVRTHKQMNRTMTWFCSGPTILGHTILKRDGKLNKQRARKNKWTYHILICNNHSHYCITTVKTYSLLWNKNNLVSNTNYKSKPLSFLCELNSEEQDNDNLSSNPLFTGKKQDNKWKPTICTN